MCLMADGAKVEQNGTFGTVVVLSKGFGFASLHIKNAMDCFTELLLSGKARAGAAGRPATGFTLLALQRKEWRNCTRSRMQEEVT